MSITIGPALHPAHLISDLKTRRRDPALQELVRRAHDAGAVRDPDLLLATLHVRERLGSTAVGRGVAVPNARSLAVLEPRVVLGRSARGVEWRGGEGAGVHLVLLVVSPAECSAVAHQRLVGLAVAATRTARARQRLLDAPGTDEAAAVLAEVLP